MSEKCSKLLTGFCNLDTAEDHLPPAAGGTAPSHFLLFDLA